jgi:hypothetical protein
VADSILTLPIYDGLELSDVETICEIIMALVLQSKDRSEALTKRTTHYLDSAKYGRPNPLIS